MKTPEPLKRGDKIAIISPATTVRKEYVAGASDFLESEGFKVEVYPHALGPADGNYASAEPGRRADLLRALEDPDVKCILCARGGYGCCHLLDAVDLQNVYANPKWLIGFSDVSALHSLMQTAGVRSLHAPMAKHLTLFPDSEPTQVLLKILRGEKEIKYIWRTSPDSRRGEAEGIITGGNLAVINGLGNTRFDIFSPERCRGAIIFIEDIAEPVYKIDRVLTRLHLSGTLDVISGLVVGQFTEYSADSKFGSVEELIITRMAEWGYEIPIALGAPVGHVDDNRPIIVGSDAKLTVNEDKTILEMRF